MAEIQSISVRHEAIMAYLMANPCVRLQDVAEEFKVTPGWLSQIIHSDCFQALLKEKQETAFHHTVLPLREKMVIAGNMALDKLIETLPMETETKNIKDIADSMLDRLGFGSKQPAVQINNNLQVNVLRTEIEEAQKLLGKAERPKLGVVIDGERVPIAIRAEGEASLGEGTEISSPVSSSYFEGEYSEAETRD